MSLPPVDIRDESGAVVVSIEQVEEWRRRFSKDACKHHRIVLDEILATVECRDCHEKINPIAWIGDLARIWQEVERTYESAREASRQLDLKRRAKCQHCGRISEVRHPTAAEVRAWDEQERSRRIKDGSLVMVGGGDGDREGGR